MRQKWRFSGNFQRFKGRILRIRQKLCGVIPFYCVVIPCFCGVIPFFCVFIPNLTHKFLGDSQKSPIFAHLLNNITTIQNRRLYNALTAVRPFPAASGPNLRRPAETPKPLQPVSENDERWVCNPSRTPRLSPHNSALPFLITHRPSLLRSKSEHSVDTISAQNDPVCDTLSASIDNLTRIQNLKC
jgi:hypothetical protein